MNKPWLGYLGSFLVLVAGILQIVANKPIMGAILIVASIAGVIIKFYLGKKKNDGINNNDNPSNF